MNYLIIRDMQNLYVIRQNNSTVTHKHINIRVIYAVLREYFVLAMIIESLHIRSNGRTAIVIRQYTSSNWTFNLQVFKCRYGIFYPASQYP